MLPQALAEAVEARRADEVVCDALGETLTQQFIALKTEEWTAFAQL